MVIVQEKLRNRQVIRDERNGCLGVDFCHGSCVGGMNS